MPRDDEASVLYDGKLCRDILGGINTQSVDVVRLNKVLDPRLITGNDVWQLCVHIGERNLRVTEPAVLLAGDVAPVHRAVSVIVRLYCRLDDN